MACRSWFVGSGSAGVPVGHLPAGPLDPPRDLPGRPAAEVVGPGPGRTPVPYRLVAHLIGVASSGVGPSAAGRGAADLPAGEPVPVVGDGFRCFLPDRTRAVACKKSHSTRKRNTSPRSATIYPPAPPRPAPPRSVPDALRLMIDSRGPT